MWYFSNKKSLHNPVEGLNGGPLSTSLQYEKIILIDSKCYCKVLMSFYFFLKLSSREDSRSINIFVMNDPVIQDSCINFVPVVILLIEH